tara:strand:- start:13589 stop:15193 length:1605 start_codon:yes stop_codon:yes gene_type:complete
MVSFDSATMFGTPIEDFGKWQKENNEEALNDMEEADFPEVWWIKWYQFPEPSFENQHSIPMIKTMPALTPTQKRVATNDNVHRIFFDDMVMLRQRDTDKVLLLIPSDFYFDIYYDRGYNQPPYYLQIVESWSKVREWLVMCPKWDAHRLVEVRDFAPSSKSFKLLNWTNSRTLMDYLNMGDNPTRPFLYFLELIPYEGKTGAYPLKYAKEEKFWMPYSTAGYTPLIENSSKGLMPNSRRSGTPAKAWRPRGYRPNNPQWSGAPETWKAETLGIPIEPVGAIAGVATNHFLSQWKMKRYGPNENRSLRSFGLSNWKQIPMHFWQSLLRPPQNDVPYGVKLFKGGWPLAYIIYRRTFNRRRNRPELELITIKPPSHLQSGGQGFGGAHSRTTEYPKNPVKLEAESLLERNTYDIMMVETHPKGLCPICSGPIPNEKHRGKYPGALSRWDNESEICSACGTAEALSPMIDARALDLMMEAREENDFALWVMGVKMGRPHVDEMMEMQQKAHEELKELGMTEHKVMVDGEWVDWEERH